MKRGCLLVLGALLAGPVLAQRTSTPSVLQQAVFQGSTYILLSESSWPDAETVAITLGGHLATVETEEENTFLFSTFSGTVSGLASSGTVSMWIGLNDTLSEGTYRWSSGSLASYRNWHPGQPENGQPDEDYAAILVSGFGMPGQWHDVVLDVRFGDRTFGIVEISPVPELSSWLLFALGLPCVSHGVLRARR